MSINRNMSILAEGASSAGVLAVANGGTGIAVTLPNYISGLTLSTAGSSATFGIAVGAATDTTSASTMRMSSAYTKTTSAWAVGTAAGSLDTGAIANSTWYHVWLIQRVDTGVVDVLISLSASAPTMPTNYTLKRRIGSMLTNGSAQWVRFFQNGDIFRWETPINDYSPRDITGAASDITLTARVPTGVRVLAYLNGHIQTASGNASFSIRATDEIYTAASVQIGGFNVSNYADSWNRQIMTNTSGQYIVSNNGTGSFVYLYFGTLSWVDFRGQDGQ